MVCRSWWREGVGAVKRDVVAALRYHLEIDKIEERTQVIEGQMNVVFPTLSTWAVTSWIEQATLENTPLVSVVMPTRNRNGLLRRAVESVCAQVYSHWEIVLTDDGSTDATPAVVEQLRHRLGDQRLKAARIVPSGVCAARNHALSRSRGEFIVYLDDDNVMHPLWLKAVVWAFSQSTDVDVVYGGRVVDDMRRMTGRDSGDLPAYHLDSFDRRRLVNGNFVDIGQIAHRRGLPEAHFDEELGGVGDWDLLLRLTREKEPLVIPVIACFYSTAEANRLTADPAFGDDVARVRQKLG